MQTSVEKKVNLFIFLCLALYLELHILPEILISLHPIKPIVRDGFIIVIFSVILFVFVFFDHENIEVREKKHTTHVALHLLFFLVFIAFVMYLKTVDFRQPWSKDHILIQIASYFRKNIIYLTAIYRIEILFVSMLCHITLINIFFKIRYIYLWYLLSFPIAIAANEVYTIVLCPFLLYSFWKSPHLHVRRFSALFFGLVLSTLFNKQLWTLLSYNVAKMNAVWLQFFFDDVVTRFEGHNPIIGTSEFFVYIADKCSGMEGLTTFFVAFIAIFFPIFRQMYKTRALVFCMFGLIIMYFINVVRIFVLISLGHFFDSETIVDAWHSYGSMVLYTVTIYTLFATLYPWCKLPEKEIERLQNNANNMRQKSFFERLEYYTPILIRFPLDIMLLLVHSLWINITKLRLFAFIFKRNCQYFGVRPDEYGEDVVVYYCRATKLYGSPQMVNYVCPLVNLRDNTKGYYACNAQSTKPKMYLWRTLATLGTYILVVGSVLFTAHMYREYKQSVVITNIKEARHFDLIFEAENLIKKQKFIEAEKKLLRALSLKLRSYKALYLLGTVYESLEKYAIRKIDTKQIIQQYMMATQVDHHRIEAQLRICHLGWHYLSVDQIHEIIKRLRDLGTNNQECDAILAAAFVKSGNKNEAAKIIAKLQDSDIPLVHYLQALFFMDNREFPQAKQKFKMAQKSSDLYVHATLRLVEINLRLQNYETAERDLENLVENRYSIDAELTLIKYYFVRGKRREAILLHYDVKKKISDNLNAVEILADLLMTYRSYDQAAEIAVEYLDKFPQSITLHLVAAKVYFERGLFAEMIVHCEYVLQSKASNSQLAFAASLLGDMYKLKGQNRRAFRSYEQLTKLFPDTSYAYYILGEMLRKSGKYRQALVEYEKAQKKDADSAFPYLGKAQVFIALKKWRKAVANLKLALRNNGNPVVVANIRGKMYEKMQNWEKAEQLYRKTIEKFPQKSATTAHQLASMKLERNKDLGEAVSFAFFAIRTANLPEYHFTLAKIYYAMKRWKECGVITQRLTKEYEQNGEYWRLHGLVFYELGINFQALQCLRKARLLISDKSTKREIQKLIDNIESK
ncbi:tetratricopeptide repeat protein [Candidatus Uabimicrobium amorphum]|uniref:Tetratricopeptide repeat protein n=1 Tax=Uabimicrobium amorphum TaxID=2596890 RepID=A0A5S9F2J8_UABAM|nr:tetratricopeptide repeat protein [Candidatus Uabimicrobium amorphum]BBM82539.1 hypothetical protein UABAM_00882 [Candidatus Uabimicrobium amorphum]